MRIVRVPDVEVVGNAFVVQDTVEFLILAQALVVPACRENVRVPAIALKEPRIGQIGQVLRRSVEVDVAIVVSAQKVGHVECSRHGEHSGEDVRMAEGDIGGVESAEAASEGDQMAVPVLIADERHDLVDEVVLVLDVAGDTPARRNVLVVPAFHIDGIDAVKLDFAIVDFAAERADQAAVFKLVESATGGGENQNGNAGMTEDEQFHLAAQPVGVPLVEFSIHVSIHLWGRIGLAPIFDTVTATG